MTSSPVDNRLYDLDPLLTLEMARFRLSFTTQVPLNTGELAPLFRSRLGYILKGRFCPFPDYESRPCGPCPNTPDCLYIQLFAPTCEAVDPACKGSGHCHADPPRSYALDAPARKATLMKGETGLVELTLFGEKAIQYRRPIMESLTHAAASLPVSHIPHISRTHDLPEYPLVPNSWQAVTPKQVNEKWQAVVGDEEQILGNGQGAPLADWVRSLPRPDMDRKNTGETLMKLNFRTPVQLNRVSGNLTFTAFLKSIISRLRDLKRIYHPNNDMGEFSKKFYALSDRVTTFSNLALEERSWYSHHRQKNIHLGGLTGSLIFKGNLAPFLPLIAAGFLVGVGKKTVYGLGRFDTS
ncbi:MAG: CRISPR system precrRNA processing endoribonuclease RAMP protein Cas6, partial [Proteobacteria bacterium]|nr:CRISPR system precrRNA processing endoribonuclease RAMP protein Cas6 [Pseudomonadota bacterium]